MTKLIIVESPSKCRKIEEVMGFEYKCIATCGHFKEAVLNAVITDISNTSELPVKYKTTKSHKPYIDKLKLAVKSSAVVYLAFDADREGERMCADVCWMFKLSTKTTPRIIFNSITPTDIRKAFDTPGTINMNIVRSQQCRQIIDLFVGFYISPILKNKFGPLLSKNQTYSAGRCQTPALRLVYDNQKQIDTSKLEHPWYNIFGYFSSNCVPFKLHKTINTKEEAICFLNKERGFNHIMTRGEPVASALPPPAPFKTSRLLQACSNQFGFSPYVTMQCCRRLYESGFITYMRTESTSYSSDFIRVGREFIAHTYGATYAHSPINNQPELTDAHEAIRPVLLTTLPNKLSNVSKDDTKVYKLIWENTIKSCMSPASIRTVPVRISVHSPDIYNYYSAEFEITDFNGWKQCGTQTRQSFAPIMSDVIFAFFMSFSVNCPTPINLVMGRAEFTVPTGKGHLTEACLIQQLDRLGIGRSSTFASLVDKIQDRKYVKKQNIKGVTVEGVDLEMVVDADENTHDIIETVTSRVIGNENNKLIIQPVGVAVSEYANDAFCALFDYGFTAKMEERLDAIARGEELTWENVYIEYYHYINELICSEAQRTGTLLPEPSSISLNNNIIREITSSISIRKSKRGDYIYVKRPSAKKPKFYSLDAFSGDYLSATDVELRQWIKDTHRV